MDFWLFKRAFWQTLSSYFSLCCISCSATQVCSMLYFFKIRECVWKSYFPSLTAYTHESSYANKYYKRKIFSVWYFLYLKLYICHEFFNVVVSSCFPRFLKAQFLFSEQYLLTICCFGMEEVLF